MPATNESDYVNVLLPFVLASASFFTELLSEYPLRVGSVDTPGSLHTLAILLVVFLSSPSFRSVMAWCNASQFDPVKLCFSLLLLVAVALGATGLSEMGRASTVFFYGIVLATCIGMTFKASDLPPWTAARESLSARSKELSYTTEQCYRMAASMLLLAGAVLLRKALWMCADLQAHTHVYIDDGGAVRSGCTMCDAKPMYLVAFAATSAIVAAMLASVRVGIERSTPVLAFAGMLQCVCVLCLYIAQSQMISRMPGLFADGCFVTDQCPVAYEMRRILSSTHATGPATFLAFATTVLAAQLVDRSIVGERIEAQRTLFLIVIITATAAVCMLIVFSSSALSITFDASIDIALLTVLVGLGLGSIIDEYLGAFCINLAITGDFVAYYIQKVGLRAAFGYLTIVSNVACLLLFALLSLAIFVDKWVLRLPTVVQAIVLCGRSIAWFLTIGSVSLFAIYDGSLPPTRDVQDPLVSRSAFSFILWHFASILAWIMMSRRYPPRLLSRSTQSVYWTTSVVFVGLVYMVYLAATSGSLPSEYPITRIASIVVTLVFVVAPSWLCAI